MHHHYGYVRGTEAIDGDAVDVFLNPDITDEEFANRPVFVVDQIDEDGSFDEHKCLLGFEKQHDAKYAYLQNYESGWQGLGDITKMSIGEFKEWLKSSAKTKKNKQAKP
jgi:inorganic pyrophosphatase